MPHFPSPSWTIAVVGSGLAIVCAAPAPAEELSPAAESAAFAPEAILAEDFAALRRNSPFLRSLDLSQSLVLTGLARIEGKPIATVREREGGATYFVSDEANPRGWRMVGTEEGGPGPLSTSARIAMEGGETFLVRFDERQTQASAPGANGSPKGPRGGDGDSDSPSANYRERISGDGYRGPPPPDIVEKMSRMSTEQRDRLVIAIRDLRERDPGLSSEARQQIFRRMVDRMARESPR